jgi:hypothetical protein
MVGSAGSHFSDDEVKPQNHLQHGPLEKITEQVRRVAINSGYLVRLNRCVIDDRAAFNFW